MDEARRLVCERDPFAVTACIDALKLGESLAEAVLATAADPDAEVG